MAEPAAKLPPDDASSAGSSSESAGSSAADRAVRAPRRGRNWAALVRRALWIALGIGGLLTGLFSWMPKPVPVELSAAERGPLRVTVDEEGRTRVKDRYLVSAPLMGNLARLQMRPGDTVEPGTVLARILPLSPPLLDPRTRAQAEARVAAANAARRQSRAALERLGTSLAFAEREQKRQASLLASGATSALAVERAELEARSLREELASAEFGSRVAEHDLQMAQAALGRLSASKGATKRAAEEQLQLRSPVAGRVLRVLQESEGVVQPGMPLLEIGDPAALEIVVDVLTSDAVGIAAGSEVQIERWGGDKPLRARVRVVEPSAFTRISALGVEEQRVNVVIDLNEPREVWAALGDGFRVEARITLWQADDVLSIPASAVFRHDGAWAVFRVRRERAELVPVEIGQRTPERVQVASGLAQGDAIVAHPGERLVHGVQVEPL